MASLLGNTKVLPKLHTNVRVNELFYHSKCLESFQYHETFSRKSKKKNTDTVFKKMVSLQSTIALLKEKGFKNPECLVEARVILEIYNSYLANANLPKAFNIMYFVISHTKEFEIHQHNMKVFFLKAHFVKNTVSDQPFDCSMDFS